MSEKARTVGPGGQKFLFFCMDWFSCDRTHVKTINIRLFLVLIGRYEHHILICSCCYAFEMKNDRT